MNKNNILYKYDDYYDDGECEYFIISKDCFTIFQKK